VQGRHNFNSIVVKLRLVFRKEKIQGLPARAGSVSLNKKTRIRECLD